MKPGRELDALVAERVMGLETCKCDHDNLRVEHWKVVEKRRQDPYQIHHDYGYFSHGSDNTCNTCSKLYLPTVQYSTDIAAAWKVVNRLMSQGHYLSINAFPNTGFHVELNGSAYSETLPHAICLAALKD